MSDMRKADPRILAAIEKIEAYITQTTGEAPTPEEIADALGRYFVLKEISDFIVLSRAGE